MSEKEDFVSYLQRRGLEMSDQEDFEVYLQHVLITESSNRDAILERLAKPEIARILHAAIGMATEAGEILDVIKKYVYYDKNIDLVNLEEELGDLEWYETVLIHAMRNLRYEISRESIRKKNVAKLRKRYSKGEFSSKQAIDRNLEEEREILEGKK